MSSLTHSEAESLRVLTVIADAAFQTGQYKESADLLRSAERLCFAALHAGAVESVPTDLRKIIEEEVEDLLERSKQHESHHEIPKQLKRLTKRMREEAKTALKSHVFRAALEFARGAEALGHVDGLNSNVLSADKSQKQLQL